MKSVGTWAGEWDTLSWHLYLGPGARIPGTRKCGSRLGNNDIFSASLYPY